MNKFNFYSICYYYKLFFKLLNEQTIVQENKIFFIEFFVKKTIFKKEVFVNIYIKFLIYYFYLQ